MVIYLSTVRSSEEDIKNLKLFSTDFMKIISGIKVGDTLDKLIGQLGLPEYRRESTFVYASNTSDGYFCHCSFVINDGIVDLINDHGCSHVSMQ